MIFILMGKSASGKDTIYSMLSEDKELSLTPYVIHTTRPMRDGETDGVEYHFSNEEELKRLKAEGRVIESRVYHTVYGDWYYFTVADEGVDAAGRNYLYIGTLESYMKMKQHFGADNVFPLYIDVEDGLRLSRALARERSRETPAYAEMCRRYLGDAEDFCEENIKKAGITKRYDNEDLQKCYEAVKADILKNL